MSVPSLSVQELWDTILDFLDDSRPALKSAALVCASFASRAQSHLFREIHLPTSHYGQGHINLNNRTVTQASQLALLMNSSPHLVRYVRSLSLGICETGAVVPLARILWTSVHTLCLDRMHYIPSEDFLGGIQTLIGMPSLRMVSLGGRGDDSWSSQELSLVLSRCGAGVQSIGFKYINPRRCAVSIDSESSGQRPTIRELRLDRSPGIVELFNDPAPLLDFASLRHLKIRNSSDTIAFDSFLRRTGGTITRLSIHARDEMQTLNLALLPALVHLECGEFGCGGADLNMLLARAPTSLISIHLSSISRALQEPTFPHFAREFESIVLEHFPVLRQVSLVARISIHRWLIPDKWDEDHPALIGAMQNALSRLHKKGLLTVYIAPMD
ncbi:hypothetical protein C8F04DRAFT_1403211 [Mycena alexandri]|uniref:Uncharacterized protein n=1 Tax=Mycena alexandri TaxID=1745969 RepID=A0AAD6S6C9_9AGAR|nr:hypothetical protein C8F04DRAFT_1403211 [Mycena alexandri]